MDTELRLRIAEASKTAAADAIDVAALDGYKEAA